jgi:hypothetical protein
MTLDPYSAAAKFALIGLVIIAMLGAVGRWRYVEKTLTSVRVENARLKEDAALLQANAKLAMRLAQKQTDAREAMAPALEKLRHDLLTKNLPKATPACNAHLDLVRSAVRFVQSAKPGGGAGAPAARVPAAAAKLPKGR